jgi:FHS family L-fucose permease-like MFS transporter
MTLVKDHTLLTYYGIAAAILCLMGVLTGGKTAVYSVLAINFFMSIMFPTIFALGVKDLGEQTKLGSSFIIMAIVGGAIVPPVMGLIADKTQQIQLVFILPLLCFLVVAYYGWRGYKIQSAA